MRSASEAEFWRPNSEPTAVDVFFYGEEGVRCGGESYGCVCFAGHGHRIMTATRRNSSLTEPKRNAYQVCSDAAAIGSFLLPRPQRCTTTRGFGPLRTAMFVRRFIQNSNPNVPNQSKHLRIPSIFACAPRNVPSRRPTVSSDNCGPTSHDLP